MQIEQLPYFTCKYVYYVNKSEVMTYYPKYNLQQTIFTVFNIYHNTIALNIFNFSLFGFLFFFSFFITFYYQNIVSIICKKPKKFKLGKTKLFCLIRRNLYSLFHIKPSSECPLLHMLTIHTSSCFVRKKMFINRALF